MNRQRMIVVGLVLCLGVLALPAGFTAPHWPQASASAAPAGRDDEQLTNALLANFAARLGVDVAQLNGAFAAAVAETADQAVKDSKLPADKAAYIKEVAAREGLRALFNQDREGNSECEESNAVKGQKSLIDTGWRAAWYAGGQTLGITPQQMKMELGSGKSLAEVARARGVDVKTLREAMLAAGKAELDRAVQQGQATQAQADDALRGVTRQVDNLMNQRSSR